MPFELALLLAAANGVTRFAKDVAPIVERIRSNTFAKNDKAKDEILELVSDLQNDLQQVGDLTHVIRAYFKTHENILKLTALCDRALRFVGDNGDLGSRRSPGHAGAWRVVEEMFGAIDENRDTALEVSLNVATWYSEADAVQISTLLNQFTSAFDRATENVRARTAVPLEDRLGEMRKYLRNVETVLEATMNNDVLAALQGLGR